MFLYINIELVNSKMLDIKLPLNGTKISLIAIFTRLYKNGYMFSTVRHRQEVLNLEGNLIFYDFLIVIDKLEKTNYLTFWKKK